MCVLSPAFSIQVTRVTCPRRLHLVMVIVEIRDEAAIIIARMFGARNARGRVWSYPEVIILRGKGPSGIHYA